MAREFWNLKRNRPCVDRRFLASHGFLAVALRLCLSFDPNVAEAANADRFLEARMAVAPPSGAKKLCNKYRWACSFSGEKKNLTQQDLKFVANVNRRVNRQVREVTDLSQYGKADFWTLPNSRRGDCEDFALLKKKELIRRGIAPERLLLAIVLDRKRNSHAVLILRADAGDYVLDNLNDQIKTWQSTGYTFLSMQSPTNPGTWVALPSKLDR
jgi:predicted transglutaminase-like cysteine proteinase